MSRPSGEKTRCSGKWTQAKYNSFIKNILRSGTRKWAPVQDVKKKARTRRGFYLCAGCGEEVPATIVVDGKRVNNAQVDHIEPVVSVSEGFTSWDSVVEGLFCEEDNLRLLCHKCHSEVTKNQREEYNRNRRARKEHPDQYSAWRAMKDRCNRETHHAYPRYGGRGIKVCERWNESFADFLEDMGPRPEGRSLDRIDNDGDYCPENCRWATREEQANNTSVNVLLEHEGKSQTITQWARELGILPATLYKRFEYGYGAEEALTSEYLEKKLRESSYDKDLMVAQADEGMSWQEISEHHGCSPETARKYVRVQRRNQKGN